MRRGSTRCQLVPTRLFSQRPPRLHPTAGSPQPSHPNRSAAFTPPTQHEKPQPAAPIRAHIEAPRPLTPSFNAPSDPHLHRYVSLQFLSYGCAPYAKSPLQKRIMVYCHQGTELKGCICCVYPAYTMAQHYGSSVPVSSSALGRAKCACSTRTHTPPSQSS